MIRREHLIFFVALVAMLRAVAFAQTDVSSEQSLRGTVWFSETERNLEDSPFAFVVRSSVWENEVDEGILPAVNDSTDPKVGVFTTFFGLEGSKQPQDFGVNANLGGRIAINYSAPLFEEVGIGFQIGTAFVGSGNGVQVFEGLGESTGRFQNFTTVGIFGRNDGPISFGVAYDFLYQNSFDKFHLSQVRLQAGYLLNPKTEVGTTVNLSLRSETGFFNDTEVQLTPIEMLNFYLDHQWQSNLSTRMRIGVVDGHGEANAALGDGRRRNNRLTFGSELFAPLNNFAALYGEANVILPADTGAIDAYLGLQLIPGGINRVGRSNRFRAMFSPASSATFANDLEL